MTNSTYWQLTDVDQAGRYKAESFGNGITTARSYFNEKGALKSITTTKGASTIQQLSYDWDEQLNLKSRTDALQPQHKTERFRHDALNRLTCAYFSPNENPVAPCISSYGYAANGNLTSKSDVGILSYTDAKHPHAITNAPGESYTYNAVGNQVTRPGGVVMTYTPFDLPKTITQGGTTVAFGYDGDERRIRKTTSTTETVYFDELFEQVKTGNAKAYRYYVHSPERVVAIVTRGGNEPGTTYVHVDHLGSTETLTNAKGEPVEKRSYDPFGQRRNENWALPPPASFTNKTTKGFTGHEEDNEFGLVNMRGRVFDPRLGRFLSTDPIIISVFDGQALNGFAYVRNNPLAFVDPSGFTEEEAWRLWHVEETGQLGIHITFDQLTPPTPRPAPPAAVGAQAPANDVETTGSDDGSDYVVLPIIETPHPSGPGTDDPFGVYPTDIELGYPEPITPFDQLTHGDPSGGRTTFIIEDETGLGRDLRHVYGPKRETIILRPRIGGVASDDESLAKQNLAFEAGITIITLLTPGPLDDMAAAGLRAGARAEAGAGTSAFRGGVGPVRTGQSAEAIVRTVGDIGPKKPIFVNGRTRIPDGMTKKVLTEVKNVNKLSYTQQLRDYATFAKQTGREFHLWVKPTTKLSKQLDDEVARGAIVRRHIP